MPCTAAARTTPSRCYDTAMKQVICSHGFGVDATDRGLFSDIAAGFPELQFTVFDYNEVDAAGNMTVRPLAVQAELLNVQLARATDGVIVLCHSQGCVTAAMANLGKVSQLIFLAPPDTLDIERFVKVFGSREGVTYDPDGVSKVPRRDGTVTSIGKDYLDSIAAVDVQQLFTTAAQKIPMTVIRAAEDEIVGQTAFADVPATIITLSGSHDFAGAARTELMTQLATLLHDQ